jgi:D-glutamate cyclase
MAPPDTADCPQPSAAVRSARIEAIERVCQADVDRGVGALAESARGGLLAAAHSIVAASRPSVVVLTGAFIPWGSPAAPETDGPPGAVLLAAGLRELGISVRLLTDDSCKPVVAAAARAANLDIPVDVCNGAAHELDTALANYRTAHVTHVVAVERMGQAADGTVRNFRGEDVTEHTAVLTPLFAGTETWTTIGIGDRGNEIGMGDVPVDIVTLAVPHGREIHCVTTCDHLIVSGVSNWGALGLLLSVGLLWNGPSRVALDYASVEWHQTLLDACLDAGAIDGTLGRAAESVDGVGVPQHNQVITRMRAAGALEDLR